MSQVRWWLVLKPVFRDFSHFVIFCVFKYYFKIRSCYLNVCSEFHHFEAIWQLVASLVVPLMWVESLPAMQETLVQFLVWDDPLEKGEATHSRFLGLLWWLTG